MQVEAGRAATATGDLPWRYLLVDVDGTLLNSEGRCSPRTRAVLHRAVASGVRLVLATGRTYPSLRRITADLELPPFHMITNGGAVGLTPGGERVAYTHYLHPTLWPRLVATLQAEGLSVIVFSHRHPEPPLFYVAQRQGDPHFEAYLGRHNAFSRVVADLAAAPVPNVVQVAALGAGSAFDAASSRVLHHFAPWTRCHSMLLFLNARYGKITEFFQRGTSKWQAFLGLFPEAAAHPERVIAVGDEANDLEMISEAGLGIAMGNATAGLKAAARQVTASHDNDGLAAALEPLLD